LAYFAQKNPALNILAANGPMIYASTKVGPVCVPTPANLYKKISNALHLGGIETDVSAVKKTWPIILACCGIAIALGIIFMILMRFCAGIVTWLFIICFTLALALIGALFFLRYTGLAAKVPFVKEISAKMASS
jgi:choline transporter-like protein 2/4/5